MRTLAEIETQRGDYRNQKHLNRVRLLHAIRIANVVIILKIIFFFYFAGFAGF
jgi:hypothetical protein